MIICSWSQRVANTDGPNCWPARKRWRHAIQTQTATREVSGLPETFLRAISTAKAPMPFPRHRDGCLMAPRQAVMVQFGGEDVTVAPGRLRSQGCRRQDHCSSAQLRSERSREYCGNCGRAEPGCSAQDHTGWRALAGHTGSRARQDALKMLHRCAEVAACPVDRGMTRGAQLWHPV